MIADGCKLDVKSLYCTNVILHAAETYSSAIGLGNSINLYWPRIHKSDMTKIVICKYVKSNEIEKPHNVLSHESQAESGAACCPRHRIIIFQFNRVCFPLQDSRCFHGAPEMQNVMK